VLPGTLITRAYEVNTGISIKAGCRKNWLLGDNSFLYPANAHSAKDRLGRLVSWYKLPGSGSLGSNCVAYIFVSLSSIINY